MKLSRLLAVAGAIAFLAASPICANTASAVSVDDANLTDGLPGDTGVFVTGLETFEFDQGFRAYNAGDTAILTFTNNTSGTIRVVSGQPATLNPVSSFNPGGVLIGFEGEGSVQLHLSTIQTVLAAGESKNLIIEVVSGSANGSIDVLTTAEPIPLPAPILLFGSALAGLGLLSHRRSQKKSA